jgi:hypothetical protein
MPSLCDGASVYQRYGKLHDLCGSVLMPLLCFWRKIASAPQKQADSVRIIGCNLKSGVRSPVPLLLRGVCVSELE